MGLLIVELVTNALKHDEQGRAITVSYSEVNATCMRPSASYYNPSITMRGSQRSPGTYLGSSWAAPGGDR